MGLVDLGLGHVQIPLGGSTFESPYGPPAGNFVVREAVASWERTSVDSVVLTTGASMAIVSALAILPRPASVLCPRPYYPAYPKVAALLGLDTIYYDLDASHGWLPDPQSLRDCVRPDTRALIWNFPGNPCGSIPTHDLLREVASVVNDHSIRVLCDDVYRDFAYDSSAPSLASLLDEQSVVRVHSFSKVFGLAGERLGYVIAHPRRAGELAATHWNLAMSPPSTAQALVLSILRADPERRLIVLRDTLRQNRDFAFSALSSIPTVVVSKPPAGIFLWCEVRGATDSRQLARRCVEEAGVVVVPGAAFGVQRCFLRVCFAVSPAILAAGLQALVDFLVSI